MAANNRETRTPTCAKASAGEGCPRQRCSILGAGSRLYSPQCLRLTSDISQSILNSAGRCGKKGWSVRSVPPSTSFFHSVSFGGDTAANNYEGIDFFITNCCKHRALLYPASNIVLLKYTNVFVFAAICPDKIFNSLKS